MVTRVTWELTSEERRKLARDLLPEILSELEEALFKLQERQGDGNQGKALIRETLLEVLWEIEPHAPDPDEGLTLRPEVEDRLRAAAQEPRISLEDVKCEIIHFFTNGRTL